MIITYPDEITHQAITQALRDILRDLPTTNFHIPSISLLKGKELGIDYQKDEYAFSALIMSANGLQTMIEKNMAF